MIESVILTDTVFFVFATLIVGAAISVVTIKSPRGAVFAFSLFCLALAGLFYSMSITSLAVAQSAIGIVALVVYQMKFKDTGERADDKVSMLVSPNQMIAVFVLLCFLISITPVWLYSIWSPHVGDVLTGVDVALLGKLGSQYFPALVGALLALLVVALFSLKLRRTKMSPNDRRSVMDKEYQA